jgi:hypothetical protein
MSAIRVRVVGNNPCTKIYCDWTDGQGSGCRSNTTPPTDWDAREARKVAKAHGYVRVDGQDYCPDHADRTAETGQATWAGLFGAAPGIDLVGEDELAQVKAEALREAADAWARSDVSYWRIEGWLRDRAERILRDRPKP